MKLLLSVALLLSVIPFGGQSSASQFEAVSVVVNPARGKFDGDLKQSAFSLCAVDSVGATSNYQEIRDQLITDAYDYQHLDEVEKALGREEPNCSRSGDLELIADLMRLVAGNWKRDGRLIRADVAYKLSYEYTAHTFSNVLGKISVLQDWAKLKTLLNDAAAARKLAALQSSVARQAYSRHKFGPELLASSLRFEATILASTGDTEGANRREAEANALLAIAKKCVGLCKWN